MKKYFATAGAGWTIAAVLFLITSCTPTARPVCSSKADCNACEQCTDGICEQDPESLNVCGQCAAEPEEICGDELDNDCDGDTDETCGPCYEVICDQPPGSCFANEGTCQDGVCGYPPLAAETACDDEDPCSENDRCLAQGGPCQGTPLLCNDPPANECQSDSVLLSYLGNGSCQAGACVYQAQEVTCSQQCENGVCLGDPCQDVVCDQPPGACYLSTGKCERGICHYGYLDGFACDDGDDCTTADACQSGSCHGIPKTCAQPPDNVCVNADQMRSFAANGVCIEGVCSYGYQEVNCASGCQDGLCQGDPCAGLSCKQPPNDCYLADGVCVEGVCHYGYQNDTTCDDGNDCTTDDQCQSGACLGAPLVCNHPPASKCLDADRLQTYSRNGFCQQGSCAYQFEEIVCDFGCSDGFCAGDPCQEVVCDDPPNICYQALGHCASGVCDYDYLNGNACNDLDDCTVSDSCANGVCQGSPMSCFNPPANVCVDANTLQVYDPVGECVAGDCQYASQNIACAPDQDCVGNKCQADGCTPESCGLGQWCDFADGMCKAGCDAHEDCTFPEVCHFASHECGEFCPSLISDNLTCNGPFIGSSNDTGAMNFAEFPCLEGMTAGPETTFSLSLSEPSSLTWIGNPALDNFDMVLALLPNDGSCDASQTLACADAVGPEGIEKLQLNLPAGEYLAVVDGRVADQLGPFVTRATCEPIQNVCPINDSFSVSPGIRSDVLLVLDNSGSMQDKQLALAEFLSDFFDETQARAVDYQLGVITTEVDNESYSGKLQGDPLIVTASLADPKTAFRQNGSVGTWGSGYEQGLQAAYLALSLPLLAQENTGFLRADASLGLVFVSDGDESPFALSYYQDFFASLHGTRDLDRLGIGVISDGCPSACSAECSQNLFDLGQGTGAGFQSICAASWDAAAVADVLYRPIEHFPLSQRPIEGTVSVKYNDQILPPASCRNCLDGWTFDSYSYTLFLPRQALPQPSGQLVINYDGVCGQTDCCGGCFPHQTCETDTCRCMTCVPSCSNKQCGDDGCGGQCGQCDFMQSCSADHLCTDAYDEELAPFCKPCDASAADSPCGENGKCMIYPYTDDAFAQQSYEYCAPDCEADLDCPVGFECSSVRIVDPADQCQTDEDCPAGAPCVKGDVSEWGYCTCHDTANPCPPDVCGIVTKTCINSGKPCQSEADCVITCELFDGVDYGACIIGRSCGLAEGYHCPAP